VVGLHDSTDEEACKRKDGKTKAFCQVLVCKGLVIESFISSPQFNHDQRTQTYMGIVILS
jgi:hypothetical protein